MPDFNIVTLFPEFFASPLQIGLLGKALSKGLFTCRFRNPRDFSDNRHRHIDDAPYGGGPGMIMQAEPVLRACRDLREPGRMILLSPAGRLLDSELCRELAAERALTLICGRYEGIDARISELLPVEEISVSNVVLNGGEAAALLLIEAVARFVPGFLGRQESASEESFSAHLLEYAQYTRPELCENLAVPDTLLTGNHERIRIWRRQEALARTLATRLDLLAGCQLDKADAKFLASLPRTRPGRNISFCLMHYPVNLEKGRIGVSSLTNLDIHDIARISRSYGLARFYVLTPLVDQLELLRQILKHWQGDSDRARALELVCPVATFEEMNAAATAFHGCRPKYVASSAQWPEKKNAPPPLAPADILKMSAKEPVVICLGTARGLGREVLDLCDAQLRPIRFLNENHLSVRSAAAIIADRILGDFN